MGDFTNSLEWSRSLDYFDAAAVPGAAHDAGPALQLACDAIAAGELGEIVGYGDHYIETPVVVTDPGRIKMRSLGGRGGKLGPGSWNFRIVGGIVGLTFGQDSGSSKWRGPSLECLTFIDDTPGTALGGMKVIRTNSWEFRQLAFNSFEAGYGVMLDGGADVCQYGAFYGLKIDDCAIGILARKQVEDIFIFNGNIVGKDVASPQSYGIKPHADGMLGRWFIYGLSSHRHLVGADFTGLRRSNIEMNCEQPPAIHPYGTGAIINGVSGDPVDTGWENRIRLSIYGHQTGLVVGTLAEDTAYCVIGTTSGGGVLVDDDGTNPGRPVKSANW